MEKVNCNDCQHAIQESDIGFINCKPLSEKYGCKVMVPRKTEDCSNFDFK